MITRRWQRRHSSHSDERLIRALFLQRNWGIDRSCDGIWLTDGLSFHRLAAKTAQSGRHEDKSCGIRSHFFDLVIFQFHRGFTTENGDRNFQPGALFVDFLNKAFKRRKWTIGDLDLLADLKGN